MNRGLAVSIVCGLAMACGGAPRDESMASASGGATPTTAGGVSAGTSSADDGAGSDDGFDPPMYDVEGNAGDGGSGGCGCSLPFIWVANSGEGTVSKINTRTMVEEGRYITRPDGIGDPSRTSVNLSGDVAVANRAGGLTKFYARTEDCVESNGVAGIQTSTGPNDVWPWSSDECMAWHTSFPTTNQRPVAWTPGVVDQENCRSSGEKVWTVGSEGLGFPSIGGPGGVIAYLVDGDTGAIEDQVTIPDTDFNGAQLGAYGGAVDGDGNLYFTPMGGLQLFGSNMVRVNIADMTHDVIPVAQGIAPYGITVDSNGNVWVSSIVGAGAGRYDPVAGTWAPINGFSSAGGLMEGIDNKMWVSTATGATAIDLDTLALGPQFINPGGDSIKGISIDVDDNLWAVSESIAYKVDAQNGAVLDQYSDLSGPYTYSDMTGRALSQAVCPPAG